MYLIWIDILKPSIFDVSDAEGSADSEQPIDGNSSNTRKFWNNFFMLIITKFKL